MELQLQIVLFVSAFHQCLTIPVSFFTLLLGSAKLFFSQRLGKYQSIEPGKILCCNLHQNIEDFNLKTKCFSFLYIS
jgi:hypothetical protein